MTALQKVEAVMHFLDLEMIDAEDAWRLLGMTRLNAQEINNELIEGMACTANI